ncbi:hypothetical protein J2T60_001392 [Natronospira proteinivora]|uniref:Uncharacterized protein n=1 Tax=Natronospira proteinivora TaxID=1807133 RepID=A0ABT1G7Z4_9GAMM|nr:hypothetical protein [Natronospira proteinivora]
MRSTSQTISTFTSLGNDRAWPGSMIEFTECGRQANTRDIDRLGPKGLTYIVFLLARFCRNGGVMKQSRYCNNTALIGASFILFVNGHAVAGTIPIGLIALNIWWLYLLGSKGRGLPISPEE